MAVPGLDKIDPTDAWKTWRPTEGEPWGRKWIGHLYRRAAFGAAQSDFDEAQRLGFERTIDLLMNGRPEAAERIDSFVDTGRIAVGRDSEGTELRAWWLYVILHGAHPLREKLTLFWHNHFATSIFKVRNSRYMFEQNCLLRTHALGKFEPFLQAISKDAAMLIWLDSNRNVKGSPNENYAREVMELFSLGVGNYTEKDIQNAARAFTGWHIGKDGFRFDPSVHDTGSKTILGRTGNWDGADIVRIVLDQPAAARFLVGKLYRELISENVVPPDALLEPLCVSFRKSGYDIAALVRTMLSSRHFYSEHAFRQRVKSPMEYVLGAVQAVYRRASETDPAYRPLPQRALIARLNGMGQMLFAPPNVKGWPGGRNWLNTSTLLERTNFAGDLAIGSLWKSADSSDEGLPVALDPARLVHEQNLSGAKDIVRALLDLYLPGGVRPEVAGRLIAYLEEGKLSGPALDRRVREAVHAMMAMAEYQLA